MANRVRFLICHLVFLLTVGASIFFQHGKGLLTAPLPQQRGASAPSVAKQSLLRKFADLSSEYGPIDCWWWEGAHPSREKLTRQLEQVKDKGVAGTWFYPQFPHGDPLSPQEANKLGLDSNCRIGFTDIVGRNCGTEGA